MKRCNLGRRVLAQIFLLAQERGEIRRDIPASDLARMTQRIFMGVTMSWAIKPESSLRKTSEEIWDLIHPSLLAPETRTMREAAAKVPRMNSPVPFNNFRHYKFVSRAKPLFHPTVHAPGRRNS